MRDYFGIVIKPGDRVLTFSSFHGGSSHYITATVRDITKTRIFLKDVKQGKSFAPEIGWTVPHKCVVMRRATKVNK